MGEIKVKQANQTDGIGVKQQVKGKIKEVSCPKEMRRKNIIINK